MSRSINRQSGSRFVIETAIPFKEWSQRTTIQAMHFRPTARSEPDRLQPPNNPPSQPIKFTSPGTTSWSSEHSPSPASYRFTEKARPISMGNKPEKLQADENPIPVTDGGTIPQNRDLGSDIQIQVRVRDIVAMSPMPVTSPLVMLVSKSSTH